MSVIRTFLLAGIVMMSFIACEKKPVTTELREVHWDRDMCSRCRMVTSDRRHSVQVIDSQSGKSYMFDDIGCTILWFDEEQIAWKQSAQIWITDISTGRWIDARKAYYDGDNITPMAYGFAAHEKKESIKSGKEIRSYDQIVPKIIAIEKQNLSRIQE